MNNKKFFYILAIFALTQLLFCSCKKEKMIVGEWKVSYVTYNDYDRVEGEGEIWSFRDDGSCKVTIKDKIYSGYYKIDGDRVMMSCYIDYKTRNDPGALYRYSNQQERAECDLYILNLDKKELSFSGNVHHTLTEVYMSDDKNNTGKGGYEIDENYSILCEFVRR